MNRDYFTRPMQGGGRDSYGYGRTGPLHHDREPILPVWAWLPILIIILFFVAQFVR